jgi:hypothetical protein
MFGSIGDAEGMWWAIAVGLAGQDGAVDVRRKVIMIHKNPDPC